MRNSTSTNKTKVNRLLSELKTWLIFAIISSLLICLSITWIYFAQKQTIKKERLISENIRQARIDLAKGFVNICLSGNTDSPFKEDAGMAYINQSVTSFKSSLKLKTKTDAESDNKNELLKNFIDNINKFQQDLLDYSKAEKPHPKLETKLRINYYKLELEANSIDTLLKKHSDELSADLDYNFILTILFAAFLLTAICIFLYYIIAINEKSNKALFESQIQLKRIADNLVNGLIYQVIAFDEKQRKFTYLSDAVIQFYGCSAEEAKENPDLIYGRIHPEDIENLLKKEKEALAAMSTFTAEARVINPEGKIRWSYYVSYPHLRNKNVYWDGIEIDITERKQMELELIQSKEKAEESDRLKSAFLANMSHEIRTPMNGILGFAELLKVPDLSRKQQREYVKIIEKSGARMLNIINDIIDISKIESGEMKLFITEVNVNKQLEYIFHFFKPETEKKGIQLEYYAAFPTEQALINTDREKLLAILINLVKNAIKYTRQGTIELGYNSAIGTSGQPQLKFFVKDTGIGIRGERLEAIFERFIQAEIVDKKAQQGAGLGLAITKAYVDMLGGKIWVESEPEKGSTFYFTLPALPDEKAKATENENKSN